MPPFEASGRKLLGGFFAVLVAQAFLQVGNNLIEELFAVMEYVINNV